MDTASSFPFELKLIKTFPVYTEKIATLFFDDQKEVWKQDANTLSAEENEDITILFNSSDPGARLYLDALDIVPIDDKNVKEDAEGHLYRGPSASPFILYKNGDEYDELRVDAFQITVYAEGHWYYGVFEIMPKPISSLEWIMMKEDLEREIRGLAQDIVRRNIGIGNMGNGNIPPKALYDFFVIKQYSRNVLYSLIDIAENPRYEIVTEYEFTSTEINNAFDAETAKRYVTRAGSEPTLKKPVKRINYNIQDNQLLKMIILEYEKKLDAFLELLDTVNKYESSFRNNSKIQYKNALNSSISEFKETAQKLRKMTSVLKTKDWYLLVTSNKRAFVPHSFVLDSRYNVLYQMYQSLKKEAFQIELDPEFSYTWKRSSYLYEMWCYFKTCHILLKKYELTSNGWDFIFFDKVLFPFLASGTELIFENGETIVKVLFDAPLPLKREETSIEYPLYITKQHDTRIHNRPDIILNVYQKSNGWYLGTIVLECKYRKLKSFWSNDPSRSSKGQLEAYFNNGRSLFLYGDLGTFLNIRPVQEVVVLTPDIFGEGQIQEDFHILVKALKPSENGEFELSLEQVLFDKINVMLDKGKQLSGYSDKNM